MNISEAAHAFGMTARQVERCIQQGWVQVPRHGQGRTRDLTPAEADVLNTIARLTRAGFTWHAAALYARDLQQHPDVHLGDGLLLTEAPQMSHPTHHTEGANA